MHGTYTLTHKYKCTITLTHLIRCVAIHLHLKNIPNNLTIVSSKIEQNMEPWTVFRRHFHVPFESGAYWIKGPVMENITMGNHL